MIDHGQFAVPGTTPSRLVFEVASELAGEDDLPPTDSSRLSAKPSRPARIGSRVRVRGPLALDRMCRNTPETPLDIPLHPAAERFWRDRGYLT